jgi:hypothetical protein
VGSIRFGADADVQIREKKEKQNRCNNLKESVSRGQFVLHLVLILFLK